jgi:hypothetical protein
MNSVFWRLWLLLFPTGFALALALFYIVLPAATCSPHEGGCLALAWALWIVGCYAFAGVAVALRIIGNTPRHRLFARQDFSSDSAQFCDDHTRFVQQSSMGIQHGGSSPRLRHPILLRAMDEEFYRMTRPMSYGAPRRRLATKTVGAHSSGTPALRRPVK